MKKIFLLIVSLAVMSCSKDDSSSNVAAKHLKITKLDGTEIVDGSIINVTSTGDTNALVAFYVKNMSSSDLNVKAKLISATNDGSQMQFCFGQVCYSAVAVGAIYPLDSHEVVTVPANSQIGGASFHFQNFASSTTPLDYVFEFYQYKGTNEVVGNKVRVTYRYTPN